MDPSRDTAYLFAINNGQEDVVRHLLKADAKARLYDGTPLIDAADNGHLGVVRLLFNAGATPFACEALLAAARSGHIGIIRSLLKACKDGSCIDEALAIAKHFGEKNTFDLLHQADRDP